MCMRARAEDELVVGHGCEALAKRARAGEAKGKSRGGPTRG